MKKSLYQITREAQEIASQLEEGELSPELENALVISQTELQEKAINYAYAIKGVEDDVVAINEEIKRLQAMKASKQNAIDRMKEAITNAMQHFGIEKVSSPTLNLSFRRSESIEVDSMEQLLNRYKKTKVTELPDKIAIKKAIQAGENVEGAHVEINYNLQIK